MATFHTLLQMMDTLHTEEDCRVYLENVHWNGKPICPHCGSISENHYKLTQNGEFKGLYKCRDCGKRFTVRQGTMFEGSNLPLKKWFYAIYLFLSHKRGISSCQLAKDIGVTQKTAWFMLHRIRHNVRDDDADFNDMTQVDETYVGGKTQRNRGGQGRSTKQKTPVMGLLSDGKVYARVIKNASSKVLLEVIDELVRKGSTVITDRWKGYNKVKERYIHEVVEHNIKEYVNAGGFHTNSIEGFWSQLKRGIIGIYFLVSPKHLQNYCKEFVFRYNTRKQSDADRFNEFLGSFTERLYYGELLMKPEWKIIK